MQATELEFLRWFYINCDFGPADSAVRHHLQQRFIGESGKELPDGYAEEE